MRGNEPPGRRPLSVGFFRFSFVCLFYISGKPFEFLLLFTRYVPASLSRRSFIFTILFERRTPLLLCPSAKKCSRSISSRAFCEFLCSRRVFSGAISRDKLDGRRVNVQREKKKAILAAVSNFESDDRAIVPAKSARVQIRDDFLIHAFASRMICARFSSLHIRVVVPGGAREVNREKSKNLISQRER